jgi:hypothetical protein
MIFNSNENDEYVAFLLRTMDAWYGFMFILSQLTLVSVAFAIIYCYSNICDRGHFIIVHFY